MEYGATGPMVGGAPIIEEGGEDADPDAGLVGRS